MYIPNFIEIGQTFCGRTYGCTYWRMDIFPSNVITSRPKNTQNAKPKQMHKNIPKPKPTLLLLNCSYVCVSLCTTIVHNTAQDSSDNFQSYPPGSHHSSDGLLEGRGSIVSNDATYILIGTGIYTPCMVDPLHDQGLWSFHHWFTF